MKQIKTLTKIIQIKKGTMNIMRTVLAACFKRESYLNKQISDLQKELSSNNILYESRVVSKNPDIRLIERLFISRSLIENNIIVLKKDLSKILEKIKDTRDQITEMHKEIKLFTSLKEKKQQQIDEKITKDEQKNIDEIATIRFLNGSYKGLQKR